MTLICYLTAGAVNLFWLILGDRLSLPVQMAIPILTVLLAGTGVLLRLRKLRGEQRRRYRTGALWVLLLYYLCILSVLLFFGGLFHLDRGYGGAVNLEPFHTIRNYIIYYRRTGSFVSVTNLLGNVVILVPLGVLMPVMFRPMRHFWTFLPLAALVSCGVEYIQWVTATGAADVDDSILNFIGAALGYLFTRAVSDHSGHDSKAEEPRGINGGLWTICHLAGETLEKGGGGMIWNRKKYSP